MRGAIALPYRERVELSVRVAHGLEYELRMHREGVNRGYARVARVLDVSEGALRSLLNPTLTRPPAMRLRAQLESLSRRWPHGQIFAHEWLGDWR